MATTRAEAASGSGASPSTDRKPFLSPHPLAQTLRSAPIRCAPPRPATPCNALQRPATPRHYSPTLRNLGQGTRGAQTCTADYLKAVICPCERQNHQRLESYTFVL